MNCLRNIIIDPTKKKYIQLNTRMMCSLIHQLNEVIKKTEFKTFVRNNRSTRCCALAVKWECRMHRIKSDKMNRTRNIHIQKSIKRKERKKIPVQIQIGIGIYYILYGSSALESSVVVLQSHASCECVLCAML